MPTMTKTSTRQWTCVALSCSLASDGRIMLAGELDCASGVDLVEMIAAIQADQRDVNLDLAQVSFIDLAGLRALRHCVVYLVGRYPSVHVQHPPLCLRRLCDAAGMDVAGALLGEPA